MPPLITVARSAGFCFGVRRAVEQTERLAAQTVGSRVVTLGPLIHNPQEVERLKLAGIEAITEAEVRRQDWVVIRSHGLPVEQIKRLEERGPVYNATCPYVRSCQTLAARMAADNYAIILVGDKGHAETESVISFAREGVSKAKRPAPVLILGQPEELDQVVLQTVRRVAVLAQTTCTQERLAKVVSACLQRFVEARVFNTICETTLQRQQEASELAKNSELVIVVGGRNSANTTRLVELCSLIQPRTYLVEVPEELQPDWVVGTRRIAVTAGASTPDATIKAVATRLETICRDT